MFYCVNNVPFNLLQRNKLEAIPTPSNHNKAISPIIAKKLVDIYYGHIDHPWAVEVENWKREVDKVKRSDTNDCNVEIQSLHYLKMS